jgi:diguanylate cyclase (GGDEF)-like protein/PAS domain S-box-containing protein
LNTIAAQHAGAANNLHSLKADANQAAADMGWAVATHVTRAQEAPQLARDQAVVAGDVAAFAGDGLDPARLTAIDSATADYMRTLSGELTRLDSAGASAGSTPATSLAAASEREALDAMIDGYAAQLDREAGALEAFVNPGIWLIVLSGSLALFALQWRVAARLRRTAVEDARATEERRFRALVQNSADAITVIGADGSPTYQSPAAESLAGTVPEAHANYLDRVYKDDRLRTMEAITTVLERPDATALIRYRMRHTDGSLHAYETSARNAVHDPAVMGIVANTRDVTAQVRAESLLEAQSRILTTTASGASLETSLAALVAELQELLPHARCSIQVHDTDSNSLRIAAAVSREGLACRLMEGRELDPGTSICAAALAGREMLEQNPSSSLQWGGAPCLTAAPGVGACWVQPIAIDGGAPLGVLSCYFENAFEPDAGARNIVRLGCDLAAIAIRKQRMDDDRSYRALHDELTGLPNRTLLLELLAIGVPRHEDAQTHGAVLFIGLDRIKPINETLGHNAGDSVLQEAATRIAQTVRSEDTVARVSDDVFAVRVLGARDEHEVIELADRLLKTIRAPFTFGPRHITVTASIGIAFRKSKTTTAQELLRDASSAMSRATTHGGNRWEMFDVALRRAATARLRMEAALREAVSQGDFEVLYQPVWSIRERRVSSVEALVRWRRPRGRLIAPSRFIPLAEETGLINDLGAFVLRRACADGVMLNSDPSLPPLHVSVNVSARQLTDGTVVAALEEALAASGYPANRLIIELTESALMADPASAARAIDHIQHLGAGLALDDFGTGFSSLNYLKRFQSIDVLKIDRSFVIALADPETPDRAIVRATIALARAFGASVVAEGVETPEQLEVLTILGCDEIQGYLFARPMSLEALQAGLAIPGWPDPRSMQLAAAPREAA